MKRMCLLFCAALAASAAWAAWAQPAASQSTLQTMPQTASPGPVLREDQLTQGALIDALAPAAPTAPAVLTRSIRPVRSDAGLSAAPGPAAAPARASLLITFETNSTRLTPAARKALDVVAQAFASDRLAAQHFVVEGHADPRGRADANLKLSRERAESVRDYLDTHGVARNRLQAVGKGSTEPMKPAEPAAPENRRVTFVNLGQ